jgi:hypothetical protein
MKRPLALLAATLLATPGWAADAGQHEGFKFQVGVTFVSGMNDFGDKINVNNPTVDVQQGVPAALSLGGAYAFGNGWAVGATVGPAILGIGDASLHVVPLGLDVRYRLGGESGSPYVRLGAEKANAGGDFIRSGKAGGVAAVGWEFGRPSGLGWGVELGYHGTEVIIKATPGHPETKAQPYKATLAVFFNF